LPGIFDSRSLAFKNRVLEIRGRDFIAEIPGRDAHELRLARDRSTCTHLIDCSRPRRGESAIAAVRRDGHATYPLSVRRGCFRTSDGFLRDVAVKVRIII